MGTAPQTFNAALNATNTLNLGDGGDAASLSGTTVGINIGDNNINAFLLQQGITNYLQVNTANAGETVSFGNTTTNPSFSFLGSGATTFSGGVTASSSFTANGNTNVSPSGTNDVTVTTDTDSKLIVTGLQTASGSELCLDGSNEVVLCTASGSSSLQSAYNGGNTITSTDARDVSVTLADTVTDSNFEVNLQAESTVLVSRLNNAISDTPAQLILLQNQDNDVAVARGLAINSASGGLTTAVDVSDAEIVTALAAGANDLNGTNWSISGSTGNIQTSGDTSVGGGDVTTTAATGNLFNTSATTVNIGGAATSLTLGATVGSTTIRNNAVNLPNATSFNALSAAAALDTTSIGGGYGSTGTTISNTGNIQTNGNLTVDGTSTLTGNTTLGALSASGTATFSPSSTNDITINTDSDSSFILSGLQTATGDGLCIDGADNVIKCSGTPSDVRLKKNISDITNVLPRVLQAQGVRYDLLKEESVPGEGKNIGFIAQDLEVLFPEVVKTDANGIKSVDYEKMTAVLVESTKEQQKQIDTLKAEIEALKAAINN